MLNRGVESGVALGSATGGVVQRTITAITAFSVPGAERFYAWAEAERGRFIPWLPVWMGLGVLAYFAQITEPPPWSGPAAAGAALLVTLAAWRTYVARAVALCMLFTSLGFLSAQSATWRALPLDDLPRKATMLAAVVRSVEALPEGRRVTLEQVQIPGQELARRIRVKLKPGDKLDLSAGDLVRTRAMLRPPAGPTYPGAWDLQREDYFTGLGAYGTALGPMELLEQAPPSGTGWLHALRDGVARRIMDGLPGAPGAVAATLLTGGTAAIPTTDRSAFRDSGLAHLLAVAGLHIGIVMGLVMGMTRLGLASIERAALFWPCKAIAAGSALLAGAAYLLLTGAHLPIMRSFAMACLVTLGVMLGRRALSLRGLALAAITLMVLAPNEVIGVSFQMSFSAVLALIAGYDALRPILSRLYRRRFLSHLAALVLTSLLAGSASAAYGAYHFGHFQLYFILSNVIAVPVTAFWVMPWGLAAMALMPFGAEHWALVPMGLGVEVLLWIARTVAALPEATLAVPHLAPWGLGVFSLGLAWLGIWRTKWRLLGVPAMMAGLLSPLAASPPDILMSPDARVIAVRAGAYWLQAQSRAPFVTESWESYLAHPLVPVGADTPGCSTSGCRFDSPAGPVLLTRSKAPADCNGIVLLVSAEPARDVCPRGTRYLDRFSVWRDGSIAVWLTAAGPVVLTDREWRGTRPWVPPIPTPRRVAPSLPMAEVDELPPE